MCSQCIAVFIVTTTILWVNGSCDIRRFGRLRYTDFMTVIDRNWSRIECILTHNPDCIVSFPLSLST